MTLLSIGLEVWFCQQLSPTDSLWPLGKMTGCGKKSTLSSQNSEICALLLPSKISDMSRVTQLHRCFSGAPVINRGLEGHFLTNRAFSYGKTKLQLFAVYVRVRVCVYRSEGERKKTEQKMRNLSWAAFVNKTNTISISRATSGSARAGPGLWLRGPTGSIVSAELFSNTSQEKNGCHEEKKILSLCGTNVEREKMVITCQNTTFKRCHVHSDHM